jgi:ankyrin repeat protein
MLDDKSEDGDATTENSIINIDRKKPEEHEHLPDDEANDDPDVYDVNVLAWDAPVSALHLAIANGHDEVVKILVEDFGADVLLPIKLVNSFNKSARAAILPLVLALQLSPVKANVMTKTLLDLGASPAQADIGHVTALHYFAAHGVDLLRTMISANRPAARRAVSHLSLSDWEHNPAAKSALQSAIEQGDAAGVDVLLELGAKPEIDFATYMTSFKTKWNPNGSAEHNEQQFRQNYQQPIFTAVQCEMPSIAMKLLVAGANVNTLSKEAWRSVVQKYSYNGQVHSLLDIVREKIKELRKFVETGKAKGNGSINGYGGKRFPPVPLKDDDEYLRNLVPESYTHWSTRKQLQQAKLNYERELEQYHTWMETQKQPNGTEEKKSAVRSLITEFESLEAELLVRESKTFEELYPDVKIQERQPYNYHMQDPQPSKAWEPKITFQVPDLTDERRAAYTKLFQACWDADLATVKELTLAISGDNQSPLQIAVQDFSNFSPYSIAVLRNHTDVAKAVLEIAHAQYAPEEMKGQAKHSVQQAHDDDDSSDDDNDRIQVYSEIIDDRFTVENIGEVQSQVKSKITPLQLMAWSCPVSRFLEEDDVSITKTSSSLFAWGGNTYRRYGQKSRGGRAPRKVLRDAANGRSYPVHSAPQQEVIADVIKPGNLFQLAIFTDDSELLHFLIAMGEDYTHRKAHTSDGVASTFYLFEEQDFLYAVRLGRTQLLQDIIKRTGAGIPLDDLVKKSGVQIPETPKYYQGLSVHGKKRADWANAGRDTQCEPTGEQHPPLLHAARLANLESVEWFQSDAALRCYIEFADNNHEDIRIQNLAKAKGGLEKAIVSWLNLRSHLLIHCVVLSKTNEDSLELLRLLCKTYPEGLHHRSSKGLTPLQLAFSLHRVEMVKVMLEAGADQTCRNNAGDNIVHALLNTNSTSIDKDLPLISELLSLIDPRLLASLFAERTTDEPGAATPLARWLFACVKPDPWGGNRNAQDPEKFVLAVLQFSKGEDLGIVNGEGDTPLHAAVRYGADTVLRTMLECRPELLHRENATGRTPYEMAGDAYLANEVFNDPPSLVIGHDPYGRNQRLRYRRRAQQDTSGILAKKPESFVEPAEDERSAVDKVWLVCKEFAAKSEGTKRKLVSLIEANEVAKRLAFRKGRKNEEDVGNEATEKEKDDEEVKGDEVDVWFNMGLSADRK